MCYPEFVTLCTIFVQEDFDGRAGRCFHRPSWWLGDAGGDCGGYDLDPAEFAFETRGLVESLWLLGSLVELGGKKL